MKTYRFWIFHADKDYGLKGFWYIDDNLVYSYGYATNFVAAVLNWVKHIPNSYAARKMMAEIEKSSKEEAKKHVQ